MIDGTYESESRAQYTHEPYWGQCKIIITNGEIVEFEFRITDKSRNEIFDENYEKHFAGNTLYINQCRNDLKGLEAYINRFAETKDLNKIDAVSGATWSYNIFRDLSEEKLTALAQLFRFENYVKRERLEAILTEAGKSKGEKGAVMPISISWCCLKNRNAGHSGLDPESQ